MGRLAYTTCFVTIAPGDPTTNGKRYTYQILALFILRLSVIFDDLKHASDLFMNVSTVEITMHYYADEDLTIICWGCQKDYTNSNNMYMMFTYKSNP